MPLKNLLAGVVVRPGGEASMLAAAQTLVEASRKEQGCLRYTLFRAADDPALFLFRETWRDDEALAAHRLSAHFAAYHRAVDSLILEHDVESY